MKVALRYEIPSPETVVVREILSRANDVTVVEPWSPDSHTCEYDIAVCVGPVSSCPLAKKKILLAFGATASHPDLGWDTVVVTSVKAKKNAEDRFKALTILSHPFVAGFESGRARIVEPFEKPTLIHASEFGLTGLEGMRTMGLWGDVEPLAAATAPYDGSGGGLFNLLEFNTWIRAGGIGCYPEWMEDGYDIQVRRHLGLGGRVVCPQDEDVLGKFAQYCAKDIETAVDGEPIRIDARGNFSRYSYELNGAIEL